MASLTGCIAARAMHSELSVVGLRSPAPGQVSRGGGTRGEFSRNRNLLVSWRAECVGQYERRRRWSPTGTGRSFNGSPSSATVSAQDVMAKFGVGRTVGYPRLRALVDHGLAVARAPRVWASGRAPSPRDALLASSVTTERLDSPAGAGCATPDAGDHDCGTPTKRTGEKLSCEALRGPTLWDARTVTRTPRVTPLVGSL
jgi:hypothetical protein